MRTLLISVLILFFAYVGYALGLTDGRIAECRMSGPKGEWKRVIWKRCEDKIGRPMFF